MSSDAASRLMSPAEAFESAVALQRQDRLDEAAQLYEALLELDRHHVGSLHNLALIRARQGRLGEAAAMLRHALDRRPDEAVALSSLGSVLQAMGQPAQSIAHFERAIALAPDLAVAHYNLGNALLALGRAEEALARFDRALTLEPRSAAALSAKGSALQALGRPAEAISWHEQALELDPGYASAHNNLGTTLQALGRDEEASRRYDAALALSAGEADFHVNRGKVLHRLGRDDEALAAYERALALRPQDAEALNDFGNALQSLDRHGEAVERYRQALDLKPGFAAAHDNLANSLHALDRHDEAIAEYQAALAAGPDNAAAHSNLGTALRELGRLDEARCAFERAVALAPSQAFFHLNLAELKRFAAGDPQLAALARLADHAHSLPPQEQIDLSFALAKAHADLGDFATAFTHLRQGNALKRREIDYDESATLSVLARIATILTPELLRAKAGRGDPSELPVFIIGMPRSGTSLVEQILASHPDVFGAGEITTFTALTYAEIAAFPEDVASIGSEALGALGAQYVAGLVARAPGARRVTDKLPANFLLTGLIHLALPRARIIHVRRDPRDTCWSCFATLFTAGQPFAFELGELGRYYRAYERLMAHWRHVLPEGAMLEINYEDIVADLPREARRLVAYCGLDWDEACLDFHRTHRAVRTASASQVRQPIYRSSIGRWRAYAGELGPLFDALGG
ncbi:MAG TPA: tetratricopeptide repeat protein [Stellaceae bacterium]|nr:tetratricopeptide repeat protein [Stellaceae bacterium]